MANEHQTGLVLITGNSSGLGLALTQQYLKQGCRVFGLSRRGCPVRHSRLVDQRCDLACLEEIPQRLSSLLGDEGNLDLAILNAGALGQIKPMRETAQAELEEVMVVNVWANKTLLDLLLNRGAVGQVVAISSGAAVNCNPGWGAYSLSKAALNALVKLYAAEYPHTHFTALAPGLVDTSMQDYLCEQVDEKQYPSVGKLRRARGSDAMPVPARAAERITQVIPRLYSWPSGEFLDLRSMDTA